MPTGSKRIESGDVIQAQIVGTPAPAADFGGASGSASLTPDLLVGDSIGYEKSDSLAREERRSMSMKVGVCVALTIIVSYVAIGACGEDWGYAFIDPWTVTKCFYVNIHDAIADFTHWFSSYTKPEVEQICGVVNAVIVPIRLRVILINLVCGAMLAVSGMLYQNVFKNPIAGPGMLGATSGVSFGMMLVVLLYGTAGFEMAQQRYLFTYGCGGAVLVLVLLAGKLLAGRNRPFDIISMMLIGMISGQLLGFVVQYVTLFVMDPETYESYYVFSQMLNVDTSPVSLVTLALTALATIVPVYLLRFKMNALAFEEEEVRLFGLNLNALRMVALVCGAIMILGAQAHIGAVGMVTMVIPFLARSLFGCETSKQFAGSVCTGMLFLVVCRLIVDLVPFVGDGLSIGAVSTIVILPLFVYVMSRQTRGWE